MVFSQFFKSVYWNELKQPFNGASLFIFQKFYENWKYFFLHFWNSKTPTFKEQLFFSEYNFKGFWNRKSQVLAQIKPDSSFWLNINFKKIADNIYVDFRKTENFGIAIFKEHFFFLNKKSNVFETKKSSFNPNKTTLFFLIEDKF